MRERMKPEQMYEIAESTKEGYSPVYDYEHWRIAITNDAPSTRLNETVEFGKHLMTDEAFVLLEGSAYLLLGDGDDDIGDISRHDLEKGKVFVVKKGTWHFNVTTEGTKILIVENRDTDASNTFKKKGCTRQ